MAVQDNSYPGWIPDVLQRLGAPDTKQNEAFLQTWHQFELSGAHDNPLNTTAYAPVPATVGTGAINSAGVQNYATPTAGGAATAAFLNMPNYGGIRQSLRDGHPLDDILTKSSAQTITGELRTWGSTSFANAIDKAGNTTGLPFVGKTSTTVGGATVSSGGGGPNLLAPIQSAKEALTFLFSYRGLEVLGGGALILIGVLSLARDVGINAPTPPGSQIVLTPEMSRKMGSMFE